MPFEAPYEGNESTRAARQAINQAIDDLEAKITSLKREKNQLASTSVLPPEILSKIFMLVRDPPTDLYLHRRYHSTHWICSVGHICHHWREVALNCPALWSIPIFTNPELVQEMMRRSKMAPLTIQLTTGSWTPRIFQEVENVMTQMFRIRDLCLSCGSHSDRLHNIFAAFSQPAPHLEQLALTNVAYLTHQSHFRLPDNAFADAPRLRSIELHGFNFCWTAAIFKHNVTNLKVKTSRALDTSTFSQLLEALGHMPNLHNLSLAQCIPSHMTANASEPTLNFPTLRSLEIDSKVADCIQFLRCIKYSPHTIINLTCTSLTKVNDYTEIFARVGENLHAPCANHSSRTFLLARLMLEYDRSMTVFLYRRTDACTARTGYYAFSPPDEPGVRLHFSSDEFQGYPLDNILRELFRHIDLKSLEAVAFDWCSSDECLESIRETIGKLPKLKNFRTGTYGAKVLQAIQPSPEPVSTSRRGQGRSRKRKHQPPPITVLPALKTLCLHSLDLNEFRSPGTLEMVRNFLIHRSNMNAPVEELQLDDCRGVRVEQKRLLGELVANLLVDGEPIKVMELDSEDDVDTYGEDEDEDEDEMYDDEDLYFTSHGMYDYDFELDDAFGWYPF